MPDVLIVNASPLILLAKTNRLQLLTEMANEVVVPEGVAAEVLSAETNDPARIALETGSGERCDEGAIPQSVLDWRLGSGESAVLAVALSRPEGKVVLDDALARRFAKALHVPCIGTLGLIVAAKVQGRIPSAKAVLQDLVDAGLWLDPGLVRTVLTAIEETWP